LAKCQSSTQSLICAFINLQRPQTFPGISKTSLFLAISGFHLADFSNCSSK